MRIIRWIVLLPASILGAWLSWFLAGLLNRLILSGVGLNPDSFLCHLYIVLISYALYGAMFVIIAVRIAPSHSRRVGMVMAGIIAVCTLSLVFLDAMEGHYWAILGDISALLGAAGISWNVWKTQELR